MNSLRIAQISDTHIDATATLNRHTKLDVRQQFLDVLQVLNKKNLDLLIISGDLAATAGEMEAYFWIQEALKTLACPYVVMMGNHDNIENMAFVFDLPPSDLLSCNTLCFSRTFKGKRLLFLDSSTYKISARQLDWLRDQVHTQRDPVLLFVHHPPVHCGARFMDENYSLQDSEEVWSVLSQLDTIQAIFCGHYHTDLTVVLDNKQIYLTPSTMMQIDRDNADFAVAHARPGWRLIEWSEKCLRTYVEYL